MDEGLATVIGMSIAYVASFLGLAFAWVGWKKRSGGGGSDGGHADESPQGRRMP